MQTICCMVQRSARMFARAVRGLSCMRGNSLSEMRRLISCLWQYIIF